MSTSIFSNEQNLIQLNGIRVCLAGSFSVPILTLGKQLRELGATYDHATVKNDTTLPVKEATNLFVVGRDAPEGCLARYEMNCHDGYKALKITEQELYALMRGELFLDIPKTIIKHIDLDYNYYCWDAPSNQRKQKSSPYVYDMNSVHSPVYGRELYVPKIEGINYYALIQIIGNLGGFSNDQNYPNNNQDVVEFKEESNEKDLAAFYKMQFPEANDKQINILVTKSEGRFLYASKIVEQIKQNNMSLEDLSFLPVGIYGFFFNCFERLFTDVEVDGKLLSAKMPFDDVRDLLELLCVSQEPISKDIVMDFLGKDEYFVGKLLDAIVGLFNMHNGVIEPLHKSLIDWLTNQEVSHKFYISRKHANEHLADYIKRKYDEKDYDNPFVYKHYLNVLRSLGTKESKVVIKDILNNKDFVEALLELNSFDSGLFKYLDILNYLDPEQLTAVFEGEVFKGLFTKHRRLLYNSGGFKRLKKLGLTPVIDKSSSWGFEGEVAKAFYYYITEEFEKCVKKVNNVLKLKLFFIKHPTLEAELLNVRGLAQRKRVYFKDALTSFDHAISCAKKGMVLKDYNDHDPEFEYSLSELIKGKILLRMLNFEESNKCANEAIRILANRIDNMGDSDLKTSHILFLAEDKRVAADGYIWQFDFDSAEKLLEECEQIYIENRVTDRYYTRFLYTRMFLRIFRHDDYDIKSELLSIFEKVNDKYDEGMVNFYIGLDAYLNHRDDQEAVKFGFECAEKSFHCFDEIEAELEENICHTLWKHLGDVLGKNCKVEKLNPVCEPWCKRFEEIIK